MIHLCAVQLSYILQAALWLGVSDPQKLLDEDPAASAFQARPEGLGLGAKFLPHHKVIYRTLAEACSRMSHTVYKGSSKQEAAKC